MIVGQFQRDAPYPIPRINIGLWLPRVSKEWATVPFVLDSGAGVTCLHPTDAIRHVGIDPILLGDPMRWPGTETYEGIGGRVRYFLSPVRYRLLHDDARSQVVEGTLRIAPWSGEMSMIPSVLGWDLLRHYRVVLEWSLGLVELHPLSPPSGEAPPVAP